MRRLILLRHAKTETDAPSGKDVDRRLDDRGRTDAAEMASWLIRQDLVPEAVLVSTAVRARQTWEIVAGLLPGPEPKAQHLSELYGAGPSALLKAIRQADAAPRLLVVGHNPGLHELALGLVAQTDRAGRTALSGNLPTAGLAVIDFAIPGWDDTAFGGGTLVSFVSPKSIRTP
jgi:phosphohistidine phosphatase